jgi:hypothetical protein
VFLGEEKPELEDLGAPAKVCDVLIDPVFVTVRNVFENLDGLLCLLAYAELGESAYSACSLCKASLGLVHVRDEQLHFRLDCFSKFFLVSLRNDLAQNKGFHLLQDLSTVYFYHLLFLLDLLKLSLCFLFFLPNLFLFNQLSLSLVVLLYFF